MPKAKTHQGAAKRFKITKRGKIIRAKAFKSHLLEKKRASRKRKLKRKGLVSSANKKGVKKLLYF